MNEEEAKARFLKHVSAWSTYGTTMYPIKVCFIRYIFVTTLWCLDLIQNETEGEFPEDIYICINQNGVSILDANTKVLLSACMAIEDSRFALFRSPPPRIRTTT